MSEKLIQSSESAARHPSEVLEAEIETVGTFAREISERRDDPKATFDDPIEGSIPNSNKRFAKWHTACSEIVMAMRDGRVEDAEQTFAEIESESPLPNSVSGSIRAAIGSAVEKMRR